MSTTDLLPPPSGAVITATDREEGPSLGSAVRELLDGVRAGTVRAGTPADRWLVVQLTAALGGFDDIQTMTAADEPVRPGPSGRTGGTASILARRVEAPVG